MMLSEEKLKQLLFPHEKIREIQEELILDVEKTINSKSNIIAHAPTGLGKTASTLPVALAAAIEKDLTVFFLTSRHTQHLIAIDTLKKIKEKHDINFSVVDIIGKKAMCPLPNLNLLASYDFLDYCKKMRENDGCEFCNNTKNKNKITPKAEQVLMDIKSMGPTNIDEIIRICKKEKLCPYEIVMMLAPKAKVIIADYYYLFHPSIQKNFFQKTKKELEKSIIIIDEAHNLPNRVKDLMTKRLSTFMLDRAVKETKKFKFNETTFILESINEILGKLSLSAGEDETLIKKEKFQKEVEDINDYDQIIGDFEFIAEDIRTKQKQSYIGGIADFLTKWVGDDDGFTRIISKELSRNNQPFVTLSYRCLDPSIVTQDIINNAHSIILISGTLTPTSMYKDLLGMPDNTIEKTYDNPFPKKNKLSLIIPETTTKFTARSSAQYQRIAEICAEVTNIVPGNSAIFFPSYYLMNEVFKTFNNKSKKTLLLESPKLSKEEKAELLDEFKQYKDSGAVLLGVSSGSFAEGIDLPGDFLKCVVVVGLPLSKPDLETKELIKYYDEKFEKGWDYGYLFPAFNKCLQSAGRCIRSSTDKGVCVYLDERFTWNNYYRCFPTDSDVKISKLYSQKIQNFFNLAKNS